MAAGIVVCKDEIQQPPLQIHHHDGTTTTTTTTTAAGLGLLALAQLDGYGGGAYVKSAFCDAVDENQISSAAAVDLLHRGDKDDKYLFGRQLIYTSTDDTKHQVHSKVEYYIRLLFAGLHKNSSIPNNNRTNIIILLFW